MPNTRKYKNIQQKYEKIRENVATIRENTTKYEKIRENIGKTRDFRSPGGILAPAGGPEGPNTRKYAKIEQKSEKIREKWLSRGGPDGPSVAWREHLWGDGKTAF